MARRDRERKRNAAQPARVLEVKDPLFNCNANWECLIAAVDRRERARLAFQQTVDMEQVYGTTLSTEVRLEIGNFGKSTVVLTSRPENTRMALIDVMRQSMRADGMTEDKINEFERAAERELQRQDGVLVTCTFQFAKLKQFLTFAKDHPKLDYIWELADRCDGLDQPATNSIGPKGIATSRPR